MDSNISNKAQKDLPHGPCIENLWKTMRDEVWSQAQDEPILASFLHATVLKHETMQGALSYLLATYLDCEALPAMAIREIIDEVLSRDESIIQSARRDNCAFYFRDPAADKYSTPYLYCKGFHAIQTYRIAHYLWRNNRKALAHFFQNRSSTVFSVDIHPGATLGSGIFLDHAHGVVIGETAVVENDVSILHAVTLGGTGKESGDRHPKVKQGVLISAGAKILGNVTIGEFAKVGAGSVVLNDVEPCTTVAGVPAKVVSRCEEGTNPALNMEHALNHGH